MAAPVSVEEFLGLLHKSQLLDDSALSSCLQKASAHKRTAQDLAGVLVEEGLLTNYQAVQVMQGHVDRFTIGPYKIIERLGFGAVSNVYLCERPVTRARVAVKVLAKLQAADSTTVQRFYREARASGSLRHRNLVQSHDVDHDQNGHFMVMDFVDGASIQDIVQQFGPMHVERSAHYVRQAALGLQCAHEHGLVHRDIKPGNLLVDREGTVKILDMGLARFEEEGGVLTQGVVLGSPEYLAPEQALDSHNVDTRADVYSLGATFYFMLTGQAPYSEEKTLARKFLSKQERDPQPIASLRPEVPRDLVAVVERMMARDLSNRYPTPQAVVEALAPWTQKEIPPPPAREMPQLNSAPTLNSLPGTPAKNIEQAHQDAKKVAPRPVQKAVDVKPERPKVQPRSPQPAPTAPSPPGAYADLLARSQHEVAGSVAAAEPTRLRRKKKKRPRTTQRKRQRLRQNVLIVACALMTMLVCWLLFR